MCLQTATQFGDRSTATRLHQLAAIVEGPRALLAAARAALAFRRKDLRGWALTCWTRAEALDEECGGASTPALRQASERLPLNEREREIVMLLGEGLTSPVIAQRLTLSARTVEGHIYRAMTKTGTTSREQLAALLRRRQSHD